MFGAPIYCDMKNPLIHKVHPLNSQQEGAVPRTSCLFLKTPLNMDTIALGGQTSKGNGRGFQTQFRVADAVSTLGELHGKRANHPYCSSLLDTPFSGAREELARRPCSAIFLLGRISREHKPCYREPCFKQYKPSSQLGSTSP